MRVENILEASPVRRYIRGVGGRPGWMFGQRKHLRSRGTRSRGDAPLLEYATPEAHLPINPNPPWWKTFLVEFLFAGILEATLTVVVLMTVLWLMG
jgi:hypothetical protein